MGGGDQLHTQFGRRFQMKSPRPQPEKEQLERRTSDESNKLGRSGSLIRRTKHLSLKMRRHGDKVEEAFVDESDCKIS